MFSASCSIKSKYQKKNGIFLSSVTFTYISQLLYSLFLHRSFESVRAIHSDHGLIPQSRFVAVVHLRRVLEVVALLMLVAAIIVLLGVRIVGLEVVRGLRHLAAPAASAPCEGRQRVIAINTRTQ